MLFELKRVIAITILVSLSIFVATPAMAYDEFQVRFANPGPVLVVEEDDWQWLEKWFTEEDTTRVVTNGIELDVFQYIVERIRESEKAIERLIALNGPYIEREPHIAHYRASSVYVSEEVERWRPLVEKYFPADWVDWGLRIIQCESKGDPTVKNPSSSASGLFQHLSRLWSGRSADAGWAGADIFDPDANAAVAAWLLLDAEDGGTFHWSCKARK